MSQPFTAFPTDLTTLPTVSFVIPNLDNDMHDGSIAQGDAWLQSRLGSFATWAAGHHSLLLVTWDEDDDTNRNQVPTIAVGSGVPVGPRRSRRSAVDHGRSGARNAVGVRPKPDSNWILAVLAAELRCSGWPTPRMRR